MYIADGAHPGSGAFEVIEAAPISAGQERLLMAEFVTAEGIWPDTVEDSRLRPVDVGLVRILGPLDVAALERALTMLIERQAALRTTFRFPAHGTPVQLVGPAKAYRLAIHQVDGEPEDYVTVLRRRVIDPRSPRFFEATLFRISARHHVIALEIHHLVSDGWSIGVLYRDLSELYSALVTGRPLQLAPLVTSFADQCISMYRSRRGARMRSEMDYWRGEIGGSWPAIWSRPSHDAPTGSDVEVDDIPVAIDPVIAEKLTALSRGLSQRGGLAGPVLAALAATVSLRTGATDIRIGAMVSNRRELAREPLVGYFVNIAVVRLGITPGMSLRQLVAEANAKVAAAVDHQEVPVQDVIGQLRSESGQVGEPYEITVALNNMRKTTLTFEGVECSDISAPPLGRRLASTNIKQRWLLEQSGPGLAGTLTYPTAVFDSGEARRYVGRFTTFLDVLAEGGNDLDRAFSEVRAPT